MHLKKTLEPLIIYSLRASKNGDAVFQRYQNLYSHLGNTFALYCAYAQYEIYAQYEVAIVPINTDRWQKWPV